MYVYIDVVSDITPAIGSDNALVCIDGNNDKNKIPDDDDYCFSSSLKRKTVFTYQGEGIFGFNGNFQKIPNHNDLIIMSDFTDKDNRWNKTKHSSYEFRIPFELIDRSNTFGFFVSVFDSNGNNLYSWPYDVERKHLLHIPSPSVWGNLVSPDNSINSNQNFE